MRDRAWYETKAGNVVAGWRKRYNAAPSKHAVIAILAVALHETVAGDAWNHAANWGAVQRRVPTQAEKDAIKRGEVPPGDGFEQLHGDSSPITGKYQTWFYAFPAGVIYPEAGLAGDDAGAWQLIGVLLEQRKSIKPHIDTIDMGTLAELMYRSRYYEGFHDPRGVSDSTGLTPGQRANIADYAHALYAAAGELTAGLSDWWPDSGGYPTEDPVPLFGTNALALGVQSALNVLHVADPPLLEDGVLGPKSVLAIKAFQSARGLPITGIVLVGSATEAALLDALKPPAPGAA